VANAPGGAFDLRATYLQLSDGGAVTAHRVTEEFWHTVEDDSALQGGRLAGVIRQGADWQVWEMHPDGDEVLYLVSGAMDLILELPAGRRHVAVAAGQCFVVPQGVWHTASVREAGELLFVTRGAGTEHRPR
jgi:mannose-6-phosphate isomerase-like protein (cupin superfamily)